MNYSGKGLPHFYPWEAEWVFHIFSFILLLAVGVLIFYTIFKWYKLSEKEEE